MSEISVVELSAASPLRRSLVHALIDRLRAAGAEVAVHLDRMPARFETGLVVDPHDGLQSIASTGEISRFLQRSIVLSTATDPDSRLGDRPFLEVAAGAAVTSALLGSRLALGSGRVDRVGIGFDPSFFGKSPAGDRSNDVAILLPDSGRRSELLARLAGVLAERPHEIRLDYSRALIGRSSTELEVGARRDLLARTRVVVYLPGNPDCPCLEWLHLHDVFANGCAVVTLRTMDIEPLVAGQHTVAAGPSSLRLLVESLLDDPVWERQVGLAGREVVEREFSLSGCAAALIELAAGLPPRRGRRFQPAVAVSRPPSGDAAVAAVVTKLALEHAALRRAQSDDACAPVVCESASLPRAPEVSVVIPVRNGAGFLEEAIASACASSAVEVEVVVVDDASTDDSADRVEALIERGDSPIRLLRLPVQGGLGAARNHGFLLGRAPLVFPLDADDLLYPNGLSRLRDALGADSGAAFAYGVVERFDESGPIDLISTQGFERALFAFGNYITAMALIRRSAWERVGGYAEAGILQLGWEDYDFWLKLVDAGERGTWVASLVARYRQHQASMLRLTDIVAPELEMYLRREHPAVFEAVPA